MMRRNLLPLGLIVAVVVLAADQVSKWWILFGLDLPKLRQVAVLPVLNLAMVWNPGVTFGLLTGLGAWGYLLLAVVTLCVVAALGVWLSRAENVVVAGAIGAIVGGAIGNVIDRLRFGAVIDFIQVELSSPWGNLFPWVFNVADSAIVCGVGVLAVESIVSKRRRQGAGAAS